jgi:2OG-Fe(II) oxygenase superfamily
MDAPPSADFIETYPEALSGDFCRSLIEAFEASPHRAAGRTGSGVDLQMKVSTDLVLNEHAAWRAALQQVQKVTTFKATEYVQRYPMALLAPMALTVADPDSGAPVRLDANNWASLGAPRAMTLLRSLYRLGPIQMQKYAKGEGHYAYWHCETYPDQRRDEALHRALLFMVYLNDVDEGGETEFFHQQRRLQPKAGTLVIAPAGFTHTHRGCMPVSGDKYILTSWILFQRAEQLYR